MGPFREQPFRLPSASARSWPSGRADHVLRVSTWLLAQSDWSRPRHRPLSLPLLHSRIFIRQLPHVPDAVERPIPPAPRSIPFVKPLPFQEVALSLSGSDSGLEKKFAPFSLITPRVNGISGKRVHLNLLVNQRNMQSSGINEALSISTGKNRYPSWHPHR